MKNTTNYTERILILLCVILFYTNLQAAISQTIIEKIESGTATVSDFTAEKIFINENQKIKIFFSSEYFDDKGIVQYRIFLNEKIVADSISTNFFELTPLQKGIYKIKVQAFIGNEYEAVPAEVTLSVGIPVGDQQKQDEAMIKFSDLEIALACLSLVFAILLVFLLLKLRSKNSVKREQNPVTNEAEELKSSLANLKLEIDKKNSELKHHKKIINELNKTIEKLEDANVNLIEQKEALTAKKVQLEDLQKQKDEILAIKFHDIKNPANAIHGLVELLESYDLTATEQQEIMESIVASSENIVELVQSISETFAKENFDDEYIFEMSSLQDIVDTVITINSAYAKKKKIRLINNSSKSLPKFKFDPVKIKEAIDNLVNNAIKYSPAETDVSVRTYMTEKNFYIEVTDNGSGIPEKELPLIFEKGVKLSPKPTGNEKSSGLGMWIVKKIIQAHKGRIDAKSKLGVGTTFTIELPIIN
jgi:signal transduction histidine kinase